MRSIIIDPVKNRIFEVTLSPKDQYNQIRRHLGCATTDHVYIGSDIIMMVDDTGLFKKPTANQPGYFVIYAHGLPQYLIAGKAFISAFDAEGATVALPEWATVERVRNIVRWIPRKRWNQAAKLGQEVIDHCVGLCLTRAESAAMDARYADIARRAYALTK